MCREFVTAAQDAAAVCAASGIARIRRRGVLDSYELFVDLNGQLASRRKDNGLWAAPTLRAIGCETLFDDRQRKCDRFARASARLDHDVLAIHEGLVRLGLYREERSNAYLFQPLNHALGQSVSFKSILRGIRVLSAP